MDWTSSSEASGISPNQLLSDIQTLKRKLAQDARPSSPSPLVSLPVHSSNLVPQLLPRRLSRFERLRCWFEDRVPLWPFPRVKRYKQVAWIMREHGTSRLLCHPEILAKLERQVTEGWPAESRGAT